MRLPMKSTAGPEKAAGERSPLAVYRELLINDPRVALHF